MRANTSCQIGPSTRFPDSTTLSHAKREEYILKMFRTPGVLRNDPADHPPRCLSDLTDGIFRPKAPFAPDSGCLTLFALRSSFRRRFLSGKCFNTTGFLGETGYIIFNVNARRGSDPRPPIAHNLSPVTNPSVGESGYPGRFKRFPPRLRFGTCFSYIRGYLKPSNSSFCGSQFGSK